MSPSPYGMNPGNLWAPGLKNGDDRFCHIHLPYFFSIQRWVLIFYLGGISMIELNVEDYCQNCGRFEAEITTMEKGYTWQEKSYDTIRIQIALC